LLAVYQAVVEEKGELGDPAWRYPLADAAAEYQGRPHKVVY
jgi:hypothetical protein